MTQRRFAAHLLAAFFILPAAAQNQNQQNQQQTDAPCAPDTAKSKIKRGLGNILKNVPLAQNAPGGTPPAQPCTNTPEKKTTTGSAGSTASPPAPPQSTAANPVTVPSTPASVSAPSSQPTPTPLANDKQPRPGTSRLVKYNGQDIAIITGTDEGGQPVTYVSIPGTVSPPVKITANPDVYVSVNNPPTIYTVKGGVLTIQEPKKEIPPDLKYSFDDAFGGRPSGQAIGEGGAKITWQQVHGGLYNGLQVFCFNGARSCSGQAIGQNAQGEYVKFQCALYGYFLVTGNTFHKVDALPPDLKRHVTGGGPQ